MRKIAYKYQCEGVDFLKGRFRCILGDDMGLGKTLQSLIAAEELGCERILIVCPKTVQSVWVNEIHKWLKASVQLIRGNSNKRLLAISRPKHFNIISYETLLKEEETIINFGNYDLFIFDEAHKIKNREAKSTKAAFNITSSMPRARVFLLSATPIMNRAEEIWPFLHIISPDFFRSFHAFVERHFISTYTPYTGGVNNNGTSIQIKKVEGLRDPEDFSNMLDLWMIRRLKDDVLELPERIIDFIPVELEDKQREIYCAMEEEFMTYLEDLVMMGALDEDKAFTVAPNILSQIVRLKQICVSHHLINPNVDTLPGAKIDAVLDILSNTGQKVVIFSQFKQAIDRLEKILKEKKIRSVKLTGDMSDYERNRNIDLFKREDSIKCFLSTTKSGGYGITLTEAKVVIFLDLEWTPAANKQAMDRVHRIGQQHKVSIYILEVADSIEQWIRQLNAKKEDIFESAIPVTRLSDMVKQRRVF